MRILSKWLRRTRDTNTLLDIGGDTIAMRPDAEASFLITGAPGSAKTTTGQAWLELSLFGHSSRPAGVWTIVKKNEVARAVAQLSRVGRQEDILMIGREHPFRLDFVSYLLKHYGPEMLADWLHRIGQLTSHASAQHKEGIWTTKEQQMLRYSAETMRLAGFTPGAQGMFDVIMSPAISFEQAKSEAWLAGSPCGSMLRRAEVRRKNGQMSPEDRLLFEQVKKCWMEEMPALGAEFRGSIQGVAAAALTPLLFPPYSTIFASGTTTDTPESIIEEGKTALFDEDMSILASGVGAQLVQAMLVGLLQQATLRRDPGTGRPLIIDRDECAHFLPPDGWDAKFLSVSRSHKCITIDTAQDVNLLISAFGGAAAGREKAMSFISCHGNRLMYANADEETCKMQSALCGMKKELLINISPSGHARTPDDMGIIETCLGLGSQPRLSMSEQYQPNIRPEYFSGGYLRTGGPQNAWLADCIYYRSTRPFQSGRTWRKLTLKQVL